MHPAKEVILSKAPCVFVHFHLLIKTCFTRDTCLASSKKRHLLHTLSTHLVKKKFIMTVYVCCALLGFLCASKCTALNLSRKYIYAELVDNCNIKDNILERLSDTFIMSHSALGQIFTHV